jgi:hypothetical protein
MQLQVAWPHKQTIFPGLKQRLGIVYCFPRTCLLMVCPEPLPTDEDLPSASQSGRSKCQGVPTADGDTPKATQRLLLGEQRPEDSAGTHLFAVSLRPPVPAAMEPRISLDKESLVFVSHTQVCRALPCLRSLM